MRRRAGLALSFLAVVLMAVGLSRGDWQRVTRWANTLCTACIGLSSPGH